MTERWSDSRWSQVGSRVWGAVLVLAILACGLGLARPAVAHEFRPALLRLTERPAVGDEAPGSFDLRLVVPELSSAGPIPEGELGPIVPSHCTLALGQRRLDCGDAGLVGELGVRGLDRHPVDVLVEVRYLDGTRFTAVLGPDDSVVVLTGASATQGSVFADYVELGVEHILAGLDHLLFVLGLVLLVKGRKALLWTVTAFTAAHSITLAASTLDLVRLPGPPVEAGIALSILLLARELALGHDDPTRRETWTYRFPWLVAFGFGLLHGFGFAGALAEVGLPADQVPLALLAFNLGVELGQLAVVAALLLSFAGLARLAARLELGERTVRVATLAPIYVMGAAAFAWTVERVIGFWG